MEPPIVYWNPTIAPSGILFNGGTRYPRWRNDLFVTGLGGTALRRLEVKGRHVTHQEVVFNSYGRVRDVVTGPDGLLYVALQLPGARVSDSTPGVVVRLVPLP
jgi:glucose/arabinose dehydrogenase